MTNDSHKARLAALVQELSVIHEKVTLASGRESDFYVDMRRSTLHHEAAPLIGHVMLGGVRLRGRRGVRGRRRSDDGR